MSTDHLVSEWVDQNVGSRSHLVWRVRPGPPDVPVALSAICLADITGFAPLFACHAIYNKAAAMNDAGERVPAMTENTVREWNERFNHCVKGVMEHSTPYGDLSMHPLCLGTSSAIASCRFAWALSDGTADFVSTVTTVTWVVGMLVLVRDQRMQVVPQSR